MTVQILTVKQPIQRLFVHVGAGARISPVHRAHVNFGCCHFVKEFVSEISNVTSTGGRLAIGTFVVFLDPFQFGGNQITFI